MADASRPLVALDIDGVLNPHAIGPSDTESATRLPGYVEHHVTLPASNRRLPYLRGHGTETVTGQVAVNAAHGRWIRVLLERGVEIGWATTWEHYANEVFGPLLGLPKLLLAIEFHADIAGGRHHPRMDGFGAMDWKREALWDKYRGRPLVWIDDQASPLARVDVRGNPIDRGAPTLAIRCDGQIGLTQDHMRQVDDWLRDVGQDL